MTLPESLQELLRPLVEALPPEQAMAKLVVTDAPDPSLVAVVEPLVQTPLFQAKPPLVSGLWLYIDALDRSHKVSQGIDTPAGSFWHGIMHRREGDFGNSHYWFNDTGAHPAMAAIEDYEPHAFIDEVQRHHRHDAPDLPDLVDLQRREWQALFAWCAEQA